MLVVLVVLLGLTACGASARTKALRVNLVALNTARDTVLAISKEREKQLYDTCLAEIKREPPTCSQEEGHARVGAWQKKVDEAVAAIDLAYKAVHDAGLLGDAKSAADAAAAAKKALDTYEQLKKEKP
ncbi:MAG: hypothetical protein IMZ46_11920 [Acidobacteria bacterium]|nr:hypothetical protein [Acidobacteriota bacterium]